MSTLVIILVSTFVLLLFLAAKYPKLVLYASVFFLPWRGLDPYFFLGISLSRVLIALVAMVTIAQFAARRGAAKLPISKGLLTFIVYAVAVSAARIPFLPNVAVAGGILRAPTNRAELQIVYFLVILVMPLIAYPAHLKTGDDCGGVVNVFIGSLVTLATLGWIQLGVWYGTGVNLFPIGLVPSLFGDFRTANAGFAMAGLDLHRMCSLAGEPKDLGQALAVGLFLIQGLLACRAVKRRARLRWCWLFLFFSMVLTYSTSAAFLWAIGSAFEIVVLIVQPRIAGSLGEALRSANALVVVGVALAMVFIAYSGANLRSARRIATGRSVDRVELEDFDDAALGFLQQNPDWAIFGTGMGNIHLYANNFLSPDAATYASGTVFRPKTGLFAMAGEIGVVGISIWLLGVFGQITRLLRASRRIAQAGIHPLLAAYGGVFVLVLSALTCSYFAVSSIQEYTFAALALSVAAIANLEGWGGRCEFSLNRFRPATMTGWRRVVRLRPPAYPGRIRQ